jgi:hypothetical protein
MFNKTALVLEGVTLGEMVEFVVKVLVNLAAGTILDEQTTEDSQTTHPNDLTVERICQHSFLRLICAFNASIVQWRVSNVPWHTGVLATLSLSHTSVTTDSPRLVQGACTSAGVCGDRLANDKTIFGELADCLTRVGGGDFGGFIGIKPNLALSAVENGRRKAFLGGEIDPTRRKRSVFILLSWWGIL